MAQNKQYPPKIWSLLQSLYETGKYSSYAEIHKHVSKLTPDCPSVDTIKRHGVRAKWKKYGLKEHVEGEIQKNTVAMFAEAGMPKERVVKLVIEGMLAGENFTVQLMGKIQAMTADTNEFGALDQDQVMMIQSWLGELDRNLNISHRYIQLYNSMATPGAKKSLGFNIKGEGKFSASVDPRDIPDDELDEDILKLMDDLKTMDKD